MTQLKCKPIAIYPNCSVEASRHVEGGEIACNQGDYWWENNRLRLSHLALLVTFLPTPLGMNLNGHR